MKVMVDGRGSAAGAAGVRRRGVVSILAMMFLVIFSSLAAAMAIVSQGNLRTAETYQHVNRSLAAAETGLRWANYRLSQIANTVTTTKGTIDATQADVLWPAIRDKIISDLGNELHSSESYTLTGERVTLGRVPVGSEPNAPTFRVSVERHPLPGENYDAAGYQRAPYNVGAGDNAFTADGEAVSNANPITGVWVRVKSTGMDDGYTRSVQTDFRIDKKVRFAILSRNRVMIGRNVMIKGALGSRFMAVDQTHGHPVQIRDNFRGLDGTLDAWLAAMDDYFAANDTNGDNRIRLADERESAALANAANYDKNSDGYVDAYDLFLMRYDADHSGSLSTAEFTGSGGLVDEQLWRLVNEMKYPAGTQFDWAAMRVKTPGGDWADAAADMAAIDNDDNYAKITGQVMMTATKAAWEAGAADGPYQKYLQDSITSSGSDAPLTFEASADKLSNLQASDFDVSGDRAEATGDFNTQVAAATAADATRPAVFTPAGAALEAVPYNSPHPYDYYARPVYENYTFTNVTIPKGANALFVNCKFIGVTFVDTETANADANYNYAGMQNADGTLKYANLSATVNGAAVTDTKATSNNLRFHGCTFEGMVASASPQAFAQARNKLQFTGDTRFDLQAASLTAEQRAQFAKSTVMTPQYSVEMGSFTDPNSAGEVVKLDGTIVAGVFDIRGQATIDGSIITTYEPVPGEGPLGATDNPANINTTIGYFESAAGDTEGELPAGGFGKIIIRYDPRRAMPDGINGPIEIRQDMTTYYEGQ